MPRAARISREAVLAAALRVVDSEGLASLSMRRLGQELGVEAMSLYRHVASKAAVVDGVYEAVLAQLQAPPLTGRWLDDAKALALAFLAVLHAHPNAVPLFATRPAVTEGSLRYVERGLAILSEPFPDPIDRVDALEALVTFVVGQALAHSAPSADSPTPDYGALSPEQFPNLAAVAGALGERTAEQELAFGLDALLLGLASKAEGR